jgi:hypothetical protein
MYQRYGYPEKPARGAVFDSLRYSLTPLMPSNGGMMTHAQAIMGHAPGAIMFDTSGSGGRSNHRRAAQ